jgi:hypothetical protein
VGPAAASDVDTKSDIDAEQPVRSKHRTPPLDLTDQPREGALDPAQQRIGEIMHATLRHIRTQPGQVGEVSRLIETEYLPQIEGVDGFISYTLVELGGDEISSFGVFTDAESAQRANDKAQAWTTETLAPYVASPLDARAGSVLIDHRPG